MNESRIHGRVAAILNRRELVLNVGSDGGVREGMRFAVLNPQGLNVRDPDSGESLGEIEVPKVLVEVVRTKERLSVARTFRTTRRNVGGGGSIDVARLFQPKRIVDVPETLDIETKPYEEEISEDESVVKIGDPVIEIASEEFI